MIAGTFTSESLAETLSAKIADERPAAILPVTEILHELESFLSKTTRCSTESDRNRKLIPFYYGFGTESCPTLDSIAIANGLTRERIRQIRDKQFLHEVKSDSVRNRELPSALKIAELLQQHSAVSADDFFVELRREHLLGKEGSAPGLLRLLNNLRLSGEFTLYTRDLKPAKRNSFAKNDETYFIRRDALPELQAQVRRINVVAKLGIANLESIAREFAPLSPSRAPFLSRFIRSLPHFWTLENEAGFWFTCDDRSNPLIGTIEKVYAVTDACSIDELTRALSNAHGAGASEADSGNRPDDVIGAYVRQSRSLRVDGGGVRFRAEACKKRGLTKCEEATRQFLLDSEGCLSAYGPLRDHLCSLGYGEPLVSQVARKSPILAIDRSGGHGSYTYRLVGHGVNFFVPAISPNARRAWQQERLSDFSEMGTDGTTDRGYRREQPLLRKAVIGDESELACALCGEVYPVGALVTAHKKKRSLCNDAERLDLNIVMPLCHFGCDYLYEADYVYIDSGVVQVNPALSPSGVMAAKMKTLNGRKVSDVWMMGSRDYFRRPGGNAAAA
jgi:hypothetical protein